MYAAKVKLKPATTFAKQDGLEVAEESVIGENPDELDSLTFTAGNPRVERITGVVHLFKEVPKGSQALNLLPALPVSPQHPYNSTEYRENPLKTSVTFTVLFEYPSFFICVKREATA